MRKYAADVHLKLVPDIFCFQTYSLSMKKMKNKNCLELVLFQIAKNVQKFFSFFSDPQPFSMLYF